MKYSPLMLLIIFVLLGCHESYERQEALEKYVVDHGEKFNHEEYYLLVLRDKIGICSSGKESPQYKDHVIQNVSDSLGDKYIYVLTDGLNYFLYRQTINNTTNIFFLYESNQVMDRYGFFHSPYLFSIRDNQLLEWEKIIR